MNRVEVRLRNWLEAVSGWNPSSWLVGAVVTLLGWQIGFGTPTIGLDASWWSGLYAAAHDQLQYGTEIVFTYGPLGTLRFPWLFYAGSISLIPFLYTSALFYAFCTGLVALLRRRIPLAPATLVALVVVVQLEWVDLSVAVSLFVALLMIDRRPSDRAILFLAVAGGLFAGAEMLMKLSTGPVIALVLLLGLIGARARTREIVVFLAVLAASMLGFWLVAGQSLGNLPDFIGNSIQIVGGYQEAMSIYGRSGWYTLIIVAGAAASVAWAFFGRYRDRRAHLAAALIALAVAFAYYKQSVVRVDRAHIASFFALATLLWLAIPPRQGLVPISLGGLALLGVVAIYAGGGTPAPGFNLIENVRSLARETRTAFSPARQDAEIEERRAYLQYHYGIARELREKLDGRTVSVEPWETTAVWAFDYEWSPTPVFQNYSAYTEELDQLNADAISSPSGPERILRHTGDEPLLPTAGIDGRMLAWDPPAQAIATLCHFRSVGESGKWQVLARTDDRCGEMVPAGTIDSSFGEVVEVPEPGPDEIVLARVHGAEVSGLERIRSLLYRPEERRATVNGISYRLVGATASDGLMLRAGPLVPEGRGPFAQVPQAPTIELTGTTGDLKFEFFRMRVQAGSAGRADPDPAGVSGE